MSKRITFDFIRSPSPRLDDVQKGLAPKESLLGYYWLKAQGYHVEESGYRHDLKWGISAKLSRWVDIPSIETLKKWRNTDIVVITTRFTVLIAIFVKILRKKVVFYDAMQRLPTSFHRKLFSRISIALADQVIFYSHNQLRQWQETFPRLINNGISIPYGIDADFYSPYLSEYNQRNTKQFISVGRDTNRDFSTLVKALEKRQVPLLLITQSYLVNKDTRECKNITIKDGLTYEELANAYNHSQAVIIPIIDGTTHLSGIRAALEAMALKIPVIIARNNSLEEYFTHKETVIFYEAENFRSLSDAIQYVTENPEELQRITENAYSELVSNYNLEKMCHSLISTIEKIR